MDYRIDWGVPNDTPWVCNPTRIGQFLRTKGVRLRAENLEVVAIKAVPIMTDLTASDGTLFEPHLNGLNHRKNSKGAVEFI